MVATDWVGALNVLAPLSVVALVVIMYILNKPKIDEAATKKIQAQNESAKLVNEAYEDAAKRSDTASEQLMAALQANTKSVETLRELWTEEKEGRLEMKRERDELKTEIIDLTARFEMLAKKTEEQAGQIAELHKKNIELERAVQEKTAELGIANIRLKELEEGQRDECEKRKVVEAERDALAGLVNNLQAQTSELQGQIKLLTKRLDARNGDSHPEEKTA